MRPLGIHAGAEGGDRRAMALPPEPEIVAQIGPDVAGNCGIARGVEREMMGVLMRQRCIRCVLESQESLVERIGSEARRTRMRAGGAAAGTVPVDVVAERLGYEYVDRAARQKSFRDLGVALRSQVGSWNGLDLEEDAAYREFAARFFLVAVEGGDFGLGQTFTECASWQREQTADEPFRGRTATSMLFLSALKRACS